MKQWFAVGTLVLAGTLVGCGEKNEVKKTEKLTTPQGTTTVTHKETVEKTGDHKTDTKGGPEVTTPPVDATDATPPATPATPTEPKEE